jgi:hypothetical protein
MAVGVFRLPHNTDRPLTSLWLLLADRTERMYFGLIVFKP